MAQLRGPNYEGRQLFWKLIANSAPDFFLDYILYITVTKSLSSRTVQEYYLDIRLFLKYLRMMCEPQFQDINDLQQIPIKDMSVSALQSVTLQDLYNYLYYVTEERENHDRARGRKVSALRSFFRLSLPTSEIDFARPD